MKRFKFDVSWRVWKDITIEANNEDEAIEKLKDMIEDDNLLGSFYEDSIEFHEIEEVNEPTQEQVFVFLDMLQRSGATNMFGATPYIIDAFGISRPKASALLSEWMRTYEERHPQG